MSQSFLNDDFEEKELEDLNRGIMITPLIYGSDKEIKYLKDCKLKCEIPNQIYKIYFTTKK